MSLLLAQSTPPAADLASWLQVLFYLGGFVATVIGGAVGIKSLREKPAITPQPLVVQEHPGMVTRGDIDQLHGRLKRERMEIEAQLQALRDEDRALREKLDNEIESLQVRVDAVPGRVIELLRNTKGLL